MRKTRSIVYLRLLVTLVHQLKRDITCVMWNLNYKIVGKIFSIFIRLFAFKTKKFVLGFGVMIIVSVKYLQKKYLKVNGMFRFEGFELMIVCLVLVTFCSISGWMAIQQVNSIDQFGFSLFLLLSYNLDFGFFFSSRNAGHSFSVRIFLYVLSFFLMSLSVFFLFFEDQMNFAQQQ